MDFIGLLSESQKPIKRLLIGFLVFSCAPEGSRTPNLLIRSQMLYPIKLQVQWAANL